MKCARCEQSVPANAAFCSNCGARLSVGCPRCGTPNAADDSFCRKCGQRVAEASAQPRGATRFGSPDSYTPKHLAERILRSRDALQGERKQVTVLFADVKGSMELLADRDPEEARQLLDPVLDLMMSAVHQYEGTVNQVMGDGIMALFGAPVAHEAHAVRASYAALRMQELVKRYAEEAQRTAGVPIQIRVGVNSGEVVVRSIGNDLHMDYTAVGQTTHLAARMEQMAMAGSILMSAETFRQAEGYVQVKPLGAVAVKGLTERVEVYELIGAGVAKTRLQVSVARGLSRFVGRDAEIETLRRAVERAEDGQGQVVGVVGEPGVGKSRLFWEFTHSHRTHGWLVLNSGSVSYGKATPYLPVIDLLKGYFKVQDRDGHREVREKVIGKLLTLDRSLEPTVPAFLALLDVPELDPEWKALEPAQRRQRTLEAVKRLLLRENQIQPLLLIFEDLHWIDGETQGLLDSLIESLPVARVLLLVNYRPEYQHDWGGKSYYNQLRLDALPAESAGELLIALLGEDAGLEPLKRMLIERTGGNPFFLEESVRALQETKALVGERGAYRVSRPIETIPAPTSVQSTLAARIDRLALEDKRLLQCAAVIGHDVPLALLQAIVEEDEEAVRDGLTHLQSAEFLYETSLFPDVEYTFKHALTHEVAYGSLLQERRHVLHARIVDAIEQLYPGRQSEQIERLAHHAFRGEVWGKAVTYLREAGAKAVSRSAHHAAVACFEQALEALGHLPRVRERVEEDIDLRFDIRNSLHPLGDLERIVVHLHEASALAQKLDEPRRLGWVSSYMTQYFRLIGSPDRAIESGEHALRIARTLDDSALEIATNSHLGPAYRALGNYDRAIDILGRNLEVLKGERALENLGLAGLPSVISRTNLTWCLAELGRFSEALACGTECVRIAEAAGHLYSLIFAYLGVGMLWLIEGDLRAATPVLERAFDLSESRNVLVLRPVAASFLGSAYGMAGRVEEALPLLQRSVEETTSMSLRASHGFFVTRLAEGYLLAGRHLEAQRLAGQGLTMSRELKERGHEAYALRLLGDIAAATETPDVTEAEVRYAAAARLAEELGMRPLLAHCQLGLGKLRRVTGDIAAAAEQLGAAAALFDDLQMPAWRAEAAALLDQLS